jgi:hypothetical protein
MLDFQAAACRHLLWYRIYESIMTTIPLRSIWLTCKNPIEAWKQLPRCVRSSVSDGWLRWRWLAQYQDIDHDRFRRKFAANDLTEWTDEEGSRTSDVDVPRHRLIYSTRTDLTSRARFLTARRPNTCKVHTCRQELKRRRKHTQLAQWG